MTTFTLRGFGHASKTYNDSPASGTRPLLVVLVEWDGAAGTAPIANFHDPEYYELLAFGDPTPPFTTRDPVNPASLRQFFLENSSGRFTFERVGVVGPLAMGAMPEGAGPGDPEERAALILSRVARDRSELFAGLDTDADQLLETDELCVLAVENFVDGQPANRQNVPVEFEVRYGDTLRMVRASVRFAGVGPRTPFFQIAHELSHSIGTDDLYFVGGGNYGLTLMSGYSFTSDDQIPLHLDPWHKLVLGWIQPELRPLASPGFADLDEGETGAVILYDESRGGSEYFILERRTPSGSRRYDVGVAGDGVCIWRVHHDVPAHLGAPDLGFGASGVWRVGSRTPTLRWEDGTSAGTVVSVSAGADGARRVTWAPEDGAPGSRHLRLLYGGNGTTPVDSGLPNVGVFYGVTKDAHLEWNRYLGHGSGVDEAGPGAWEANTGNHIGRGWGSMLHLLGCGDGVLLAVLNSGEVRYYRYAGDGTADASGGTGWAPTSSATIGTGWDRYRTMFVLPKQGREDTLLRIFGVAGNGDLHWHCYLGDGEADPTGSSGWHDNSGHRVGNGWQDFDHLVGSGSTVFGVRGDDLYWYTYTGIGVEDVSGGTGWVAGSGTIVGRGFSGQQHLFAGTNGAGHVLYGVNPAGELRWWRYSGHGQPVDEAPDAWDPRSGTVIGRGW